MNDRPFSSRALAAVVYSTTVSSVYFALGVIAHRANGLTPAVLLAAGIFFQLTAMTYGEGASLHQERGGSAVFARYAFNELVSFVAAWAIMLDYTILIAVTALTVPAYLAAFGAPIGRGGLELAVALAVIAFVAMTTAPSGDLVTPPAATPETTPTASPRISGRQPDKPDVTDSAKIATAKRRAALEVVSIRTTSPRASSSARHRALPTWPSR